MSFLFRHRDPGSRHVYRYGPLRITCVDRDVPIDVRVNAHLIDVQGRALLGGQGPMRHAVRHDRP